MGNPSSLVLRKALFAFLGVIVLAGLLGAAASSSSASGTTPRTTAPPPSYSTNTTNQSNGVFPNTNFTYSPGIFESPAMEYALMRGPMAYFANGSYVFVVDTSTWNVISRIKPPVSGAHFDGVAVSPDSQYLYVVYSWSKYEDDYYGGHYDYFSQLLRMNASSEQPIDYYEVDDIYPEHLSVAPDGRVYLGFQNAIYPSDAGIRIFDFQQSKAWHLDEDSEGMAYSTAFAPDGSHLYYSYWYEPYWVYDLDWSANKIHFIKSPANTSTDYEYPRSIAIGKGGTMLYAALSDRTGIFAVNTQDYGKQVIPTLDYPLALATSSDGETLYMIGYFLDSNDKPIYTVHKYGGLKTVGPFNSEFLDYAIVGKDSFYTTDSMSYITVPDGNRPSAIAMDADNRFAYVSTIAGDGVYNVYGDGIIVYDMEYMNNVKTIDAGKSLHDVAISRDKIVFSPPADYGYLQGISSRFHGQFTTDLLYPTLFYPENGSFAKDYTKDFFEVYAIFSDQLDNRTVNSSTFWLSEKSGANISGKVVAASKIAIFALDSQLKPDTDYVAHISRQIASKGGKQMYADIEWSFTTKNISYTLVPITSLLNITLAKERQFTLAGNFSLASISANATPGSGQRAPPPETVYENQTQEREGGPQGEAATTSETGTQPPVQQGLPNVSNATTPAANATSASQGGYEPASPETGTQEQGGDIFSAIINFFKGLFGLK